MYVCIEGSPLPFCSSTLFTFCSARCTLHFLFQCRGLFLLSWFLFPNHTEFLQVHQFFSRTETLKMCIFNKSFFLIANKISNARETIILNLNCNEYKNKKTEFFAQTLHGICIYAHIESVKYKYITQDIQVYFWKVNIYLESDDVALWYIFKSLHG